MKYTGTRIPFVLIAVLIITSCNNEAFLPTSIVTEPTAASPSPVKEILINNDRFNKPYKLLGQVEYTLKIPKPVNLTDLRNQAVYALKNEAYAKYGDKVDAIIDTKVQENTEDNYDDSLAVTHITGIAISFDEHKKEKSEKHKNVKRKNISITFKKQTVRKRIRVFAKKSPTTTTQKIAPPEIEITPEEILK